MVADRFGSGAVTFRTVNDSNRPAVRLLSPSTDASSPSGDGLWSDKHVSTLSSRNESPTSENSHVAESVYRRSNPVGRLPSDSPGTGHFNTAATLVFTASATSAAAHRSRPFAVYELAAAGDNLRPSPPRAAPQLGELLLRRPEAALALVPRPAVLFFAGALAGAIGKTITAPLDRVKILLQVKGGLECEGVRRAAASGGVWKSLVAIGKAEGLGGYWRGNFPQVLRVIPYSAAQLYSYELFKRCFKDRHGELPIRRRLAAGACAGMASTLLTYPLDTLRLRLAVDPSLRGVRAASVMLMREGGASAFFRGLGIALLGIAPYMAIELAVFDLLPGDMPAFARGFSAALIATSVCYPMDTLRRQVQLQSTVRTSVSAVLQGTLATEGVRGLYRGFVPNALKNLPNKGIRLSTFDAAKKLLNRSERAYKEEVANAQR